MEARVAKIVRRVRAKMTVILMFAKWFKEDTRIEPSGDWNGSGVKMGKNSGLSYRKRVSMELRSYREKAVELDCTGALKRRARKLKEKSKGGNVQVSNVSDPGFSHISLVYLIRPCSPV